MLARTPAAIVPLVAVVCVWLPMFAAWDLRGAVGVLRAGSPSNDAWAAIASLRRSLRSLPEIQHPLGISESQLRRDS